MRNQPGKIKQSRRSRQGSGGNSTDNRRDQNREGRFTEERHSGDRPPDPSRSPSSNFGDDEIGGTSFDPGPVHSEAKRRDERTAKKVSGAPAGTDNKKMTPRI